MNHKTTRRYQKYNLKLLKIAIDAQKNEDCCSQFLTIKNGSNPVFEPNILAGVEGLEPSRTVLETMSYKKDCPNCSHRSAVCATCSFEPYALWCFIDAIKNSLQIWFPTAKKSTRLILFEYNIHSVKLQTESNGIASVRQ